MEHQQEQVAEAAYLAPLNLEKQPFVTDRKPNDLCFLDLNLLVTVQL